MLHWHYNPHSMDAPLGHFEPKCLLKVQYLNNRFFDFSVKFLSIMRSPITNALWSQTMRS